ncbi:MAG: hypothetical protein UIG52_06925, partial [Bacteroidales bacterium]|nr:hypothetical protein [Bacteroidales bacterium]
VADGKLLIIDGNKIQMVRNDVLPPSSVTAFIPFKANQKINVATKKKGMYTILGEQISEEKFNSMTEELRRTLK